MNSHGKIILRENTAYGEGKLGETDKLFPDFKWLLPEVGQKKWTAIQ